MTATAKGVTLTLGMDGGGVTKAPSKTYTGSARISIEEDVPDSSTDFSILFTCDVSAVTACYILSTQDITMETNAVDATGGDTIALKANVPYPWCSDSYDSFLLTTDVLAAGSFWTNASGATATVTIEMVLDATPA